MNQKHCHLELPISLGIPYAGRVLPTEKNLKEGIETAALLEDVGHEDEITEREDTTYFSAGTFMMVKWTGDLHPTDAKRMMRPVHPFTGEFEVVA